MRRGWFDGEINDEDWGHDSDARSRPCNSFIALFVALTCMIIASAAKPCEAIVAIEFHAKGLAIAHW